VGGAAVCSRPAAGAGLAESRPGRLDSAPGNSFVARVVSFRTLAGEVDITFGAERESIPALTSPFDPIRALSFHAVGGASSRSGFPPVPAAPIAGLSASGAGDLVSCQGPHRYKARTTHEKRTGTASHTSFRRRGFGSEMPPGATTPMCSGEWAVFSFWAFFRASWM
jgi:hypothetical protein